MMCKVNVSGILFPSYPKQKGKRITWSQVNLGTVNLCLLGGGGCFQLYLAGGGGLMQKKGSPQDFYQISGVLHRCLSYTSLSFRGTTFSIVEDTQLLLSEKKEGIYAYVSQHVVFVIFIPLF